MYKIEQHTDFTKDLKEILKKGVSLTTIKETIILLVEDGKLPSEYIAHRHRAADERTNRAGASKIRAAVL